MTSFMHHPSTEHFFPCMMHGWNAYANDNMTDAEKIMSMTKCNCGNLIDAFTIEDEAGVILPLKSGACARCRNEIIGLIALKEKTDQFVQDVFDWVAPLRRHALLAELYDLQNIVNDKIKEAVDV